MEHHIDAVVPLRPLAPTDQRVGYVERSTTCDELAGHFAAGRLTGDELNQRLEIAMEARTARELRRVLADLPAARTPGAPEAQPRPVRTGKWTLTDGLVVALLMGSAAIVAVIMLGLALSGEAAMFFFAVLGGTLAAVVGGCLVQLLHRSRQR